MPDWQRDALRRIASSEQLSAEDTAAILARLKVAHGIQLGGDHACIAPRADDLPVEGNDAAPTILVGVGPVCHVDRLAPDQELQFALKGITLVYGDNGSGKSGYARVAKKLCHARVVDDLRGNVFEAEPEPPAEVRFRFMTDPNAQPTQQEWRDGDARPEALSRVMVLDSANVNIYVAGRNEITYLPREIEIIARLGEACTSASAACQQEAEAIERQYRGNPPAGYGPKTTSGKLVAKLVTGTVLNALPLEDAISAASAWDDAKENEFAALAERLARNPAVIEASHRRAAATLVEIVDEFTAIDEALKDGTIDAIRNAIATAKAATEAAALSAKDVFLKEPVPGTGSGSWELMYKYARAFAAEVGIKPKDQSFLEGDPCPMCQHPLDEDAAQRLQRFDTYVASEAAQAAAQAAATIAAIVERLEALSIKTKRDIDRGLAEYHAGGAVQASLVESTVAYALAAALRRNAVVTALNARELATLDALPHYPSETLRDEAERLEAEADELAKQPAHDPADVARLAELTDAKKLSAELEHILTRRSELERRLRLQNCRTACDTTSVSHFATSRRKELVTPQLKSGIVAEIANLDMDYVPLRFEEQSDHGRNLFEMSLETNRAVRKNQVMSESEQRALGIACFLAEAARVPGKHALIVDDPVTSLDQQRLRRVAERLAKEALEGRQVVIFTHNLVFYKEVLSVAAETQVPVLQNFISKRDGKAGIISNNDEPWIAKKVTKRIADLHKRLAAIPANVDCGSEAHRRLVKEFYGDLRDTWERMVEEVLLGGVVERFESGIKTQSLKSITVTDEDYQTVFAAMKRVSEKVHDMAAGRNIAAPDVAEMKRDVDALDTYRGKVRERKSEMEDRRKALEEPPKAEVA